MLSKHPYTFRLVLRTGRQLLLGAESEQQMNEWIAHINYASAFKTAGIRMRTFSSHEAERTVTQNSINRENTGSPSSSYRERSSPSGTRRDQSRLGIVRVKIDELEEKISTTQAQLDAEMRYVRNLAVLAPFQRSTRERVQAAIINLSRNIRRLRLEVIRWTCHRDVLAADLAAEMNDRKHAAASRMQHVADDVPLMTISSPDDTHNPDQPQLTIDLGEVGEEGSGQRESSICESFHSALDFPSDWPVSGRPSGSVGSASGWTLDLSSSLSVPGRRTSETMQSPLSITPNPSSPPENRLSRSDVSLRNERTADRSDVDEQSVEERAEDWDKTRAGKRVSLVSVPECLRGERKLQGATSFRATSIRTPAFDEQSEE